MHHPAQRGGIAHPIADRVSYSDTDPDANELTHTVAVTDHVAIVRSIERTLDQRRVGARRGDSPLPID